MDEHKENLDEIICWCSNVSRGQIYAAMADGARTLRDIKQRTGACTLCQCAERNPKGTCCGGDILRVMREYLEAHGRP